MRKMLSRELERTREVEISWYPSINGRRIWKSNMTSAFCQMRENKKK